MSFPDRIERTVTLTRPPSEVWQALTTADGLSAWFGDRATIDLRPGGAATMTFAGGTTVDMRVERVEEPTVFAYTWRLPNLPDDDPRRTYVEFTLEPHPDGTLLRVVETGFAQLPVDTRRGTYESHSDGWSRELAELAEHLNGA
ncbi:MAG: SRPBCC domain-containing protein [Acidimicrobiia bacterium]|nr:SRPBCC domain-containing protein [Acidimicrobiia bacterium]